MPNTRPPYPNELYHWGIKGMKWGIRRFQNPDGSLTPAGKKRYGRSESAEQSVNSFKKSGWNVDDESQYSTYLTKTKNGVDFLVSVDHDDSSNMTVDTANSLVNKLSEKPKTLAKNLSKYLADEEYERFKDSIDGASKDDFSKNMKISYIYLAQFSNGSIVAEANLDFPGLYGQFSVEFDPKTGKMHRTSYND